MRYVTVAKQIFLFFWLAMFLYITTSLFLNTGEVNLQTEMQLQRTMKELDLLHSQNRELSSAVDLLRKAYLNHSKDTANAHEVNSVKEHDINPIKEHDVKPVKEHDIKSMNEHDVSPVKEHDKSTNKEDTPVKMQQTSSQSEGPSVEQELARRKVDTDAREFWYFMRSELQKLRRQAVNTSLEPDINALLQSGAVYQKTLKNDLISLSDDVDGLGDWRLKESQQLGDLVQRRLNYLQNPKSCNDTKKLLCKTTKQCGFGCQLHHLAYCLIVAYYTQRTMILQSVGWKYAPHGWETLFLPMSRTCTDADGKSRHPWTAEEAIRSVQVVEMPIIDSMAARPAALPLAVPADLADRLTRFHGNPAAWWIGQIVTYLTRPQPMLKTEWEKTKFNLNFSSPIVGVQVRRTDKLTAHEAGYHSVAEYMTYVEEWFEMYEQKHPGVERKVFLATDDSGVLNEAKLSFPQYTFLNDKNSSISAALTSRYSETSVRGVMSDIHILSLCDYLVCTFSSQVCRAAYELMQPIRGDASGWFKSLDDIYYYGGQHPHEVIAVEQHIVPDNSNGIDLKVGDILHIAGNHWDGYSKGFNTRTKQTGLFPSYKVRDKVVKVKMPTYPEVPPNNS